MSEQKFGTWIPTSERLPEPDVFVLAYSDCFEAGCFVLSIDDDGWWRDEDSDHWMTKADIVAWMPLPEPYMEEGATE